MDTPSNQQQATRRASPKRRRPMLAREQRIPASEEPTQQHAVDDVCRGHTTPPGSRPTHHTQPPGVCNRSGAEVSGNGVDVGGPRRAEPTREALHPVPLGLTPLEENRRDLHKADSMRSRITSVSCRGLARMYEFLTRSKPDQTDGRD